MTKQTDVTARISPQYRRRGGFAVAAGARMDRCTPRQDTFQLDWIAYGSHAPFYTALEKAFYGSTTST